MTITKSKYTKTTTKVVKKPIVLDVIDLTDSDNDETTPTTPIYIGDDKPNELLPWDQRMCYILGYTADEARKRLETGTPEEVAVVKDRLIRPDHTTHPDCQCSVCIPSSKYANDDDYNDDPICSGCGEEYDDTVDEEGNILEWIPEILDGVVDPSNLYCAKCLKKIVKVGGICHLCHGLLSKWGYCKRDRDQIWNKV